MNRPDFLPKDTTPLRCGTETINVYPRLSVTAEDDKKSHAFHVTSAALDVATFIKHNARATFLSEHFGLSSEMILLNSEMLDKWNALWCHPKNHTLINYMSVLGVAIPNCFDDQENLKPVQDGVAADCRPNGIKYMTVSTIITFADGEQLHFTQSFDFTMQDETVTRLEVAALPLTALQTASNT